MKKILTSIQDVILMWGIKAFLYMIPKEDVIKKRWMGWTDIIFQNQIKVLYSK